MFCRNCGENIGESAFCPKCGTPSGAQPAPTQGTGGIVCPRCQSNHIKVEIMQVEGRTKKHGVGLGGNINNAARALTAISTLGMSNLVWKKSKGTEKTSYRNAKICLCQNCGNSWEIK